MRGWGAKLRRTQRARRGKETDMRDSREDIELQLLGLHLGLARLSDTFRDAFPRAGGRRRSPLHGAR